MELGHRGLPLSGSPPRVRSRPACGSGWEPFGRITSACAEQTEGKWNCVRRAWDHLRVCGADKWRRGIILTLGGSPPRVRSRHARTADLADLDGITSACAEQTRSGWRRTRLSRDHLRVCGADAMAEPDPLLERGSPPRVRSRQTLVPGRRPGRGITSACAEQTQANSAG